MDDLVEQAYEEIKGGSGFSGDYKYDADILASEIATTGGKIYDDLAAVEKAGIYDLAYKRVIRDLKAKMDFKKDLKDVEQKIELQMFDPKGKKGNATGGRIGFGSGNGIFGKEIKWENLNEDQKKWLRENQHMHNVPIPPEEEKASGGLIPGYATGGVSNLFRSR